MNIPFLGGRRREEQREQESQEEAQDENSLLDDSKIQEALENRSFIPASKEQFWQENIKTNPPTAVLTKEFVEETSDIDHELNHYSKEQIRRALFRISNDLHTLFTQEVSLSFIDKKTIELIRLAFQYARESLVYNERADIEFQLFVFYGFAYLGYARLALSRGEGGNTVSAINTTNVNSRQNIQRTKGRSQNGGGGIGEAISNFFSGGFGGGGILSGGYI